MKRSRDRSESSSDAEGRVLDVERSPESSFCYGRELPFCLAREVQAMPRDRQESVSKDVLGIPHRGEDLSEELIGELFEQLRDLEEKDKAAWEMARQRNQHYANSRKLAMAFLRSVDGKPKQAAKRFARHFQVKLDLFGPDKLVKDIELNDLSEDDTETLRAGGFQVLPSEDRAGRPVLFGRYTLMKYREPKNVVRSLFYIWSTMVEDEAHQKSGIVAVGFENGKLPMERFEIDEAAAFDLQMADGFDRDLAREILKVPLAVPIRPMGYHICADTTQWQSVFDMVLSTLCKFIRLRIRFHYGSDQETKYALMTHGIPVESFPITDSGEVDLTHHYAWMESRRAIEESRRAQAAAHSID